MVAQRLFSRQNQADAEPGVVTAAGILELMNSPAHYRHWVARHPVPTSPERFDAAMRDLLLCAGQRYSHTGEPCWAIRELGVHLERAQGMVRAIRSHRGAVSLLQSGTAKKSITWTDTDTGIECNTVAHWIAKGDSPSIVLVVPAEHASRETFPLLLVQQGLDVQAAFLQDGIHEAMNIQMPVVMIAVERRAPHVVAAYKVGEDIICAGRRAYSGALELLAWCREHGSWPGYQPAGEIQEITMPARR